MSDEQAKFALGKTVDDMKVTRRQLKFIDHDVQGALVKRILMYWAYSVIGVSLILLFWTVTTTPDKSLAWVVENLWSRFGPALTATFLLLPIVILDIVRISNRFVGPMYRLRTATHELAAGNSIRPISFRDDDFWQSMAEDFNQVASQLQKYRDQEVKGSRSLEETLAQVTASLPHEEEETCAVGNGA